MARCSYLRRTALAALLGSLALAATAAANTYCVNTTGPDCQVGPLTLPVALTSAQSHAGADTVTIGAGTYTGPFAYTGNSTNPVTVVGAGRSAGGTVLTLPADATTSSAVLNASFADVSNLRVLFPLATASGATLRLFGINDSGGGDAVHDIDAVTAPGFGGAPGNTHATVAGVYLQYAGSVRNSRFDLEPVNGTVAIQTGFGAAGDVISIDGVTVARASNGIAVGSSPDVRVSASDITAGTTFSAYDGTARLQSTVLRAKNTGILMGTPSATTPQSVVADNVTIHGPGTTGAGVDMTSANAAASVTLRSSIIDGVGHALSRGATNGKQADLVVQDSDIFGGGTPSSTGSPGAITQTDVVNVDPAFTNAPLGDLTLSAASPLIDKGTAPAPGTLGATDLLGAMRVVDGDGDGNARVDQGAYERPAPVAPTVSPTATPASPTPTPSVAPTPAPDTVAPKVKVTFPKRLKRHVLRGKKGTKLTVTCDEPCSLAVTLATKRGKTLRKVSTPIAPKRTVALRVTSRKTRRALRRTKKVKLTIVATDAAGNARKVMRTIKLKA